MLQSTLPMRLTNLSLTNYRNFIRLETSFPPGPTLLVGANAQGKTSLLEAINYLTSASSPHTSSDRQLINFLAWEESIPFARLVAEVERADRLHKIEIRLLLEENSIEGDRRLRKEILINGVKRRVSDLAGVFNAVMFLPQDLRVIEGSPGDRRRFLDAALTQADVVYARTLREYGHVLSQRNALLKRLQERDSDNGQLRFWDEQLCELGAALIRARALALSELDDLTGPIHLALTRAVEALRLDYRPSYDPATEPKGQLGLPMETAVDHTSIPRETIRAGMLKALQRTRADEIARGMTLLGPHRDDFNFRADGIDLSVYGSRGQNRTAMLAVQLATVEWLKDRTGETPVLLLDEVLAELDPIRREDLLQRVQTSQQAILTASDLAMFNEAFCNSATIWYVSAGTLSPK
jgi:DNA replication and repair protein RecF